MSCNEIMDKLNNITYMKGYLNLLKSSIDSKDYIVILPQKSEKYQKTLLDTLFSKNIQSPYSLTFNFNAAACSPISDIVWTLEAPKLRAS